MRTFYVVKSDFQCCLAWLFLGVVSTLFGFCGKMIKTLGSISRIR